MPSECATGAGEADEVLDRSQGIAPHPNGLEFPRAQGSASEDGVFEQDAVESDDRTDGVMLPNVPRCRPRGTVIQIEISVFFSHATRESAELHEPPLDSLQLVPKLAPVVVQQATLDLLLVPLGGQRLDVADEGLDRNRGDVPALRPLVIDGPSDPVEELVEAVESGLLIARLVAQRLRRNACAELPVEDAGSLPVQVSSGSAMALLRSANRGGAPKLLGRHTARAYRNPARNRTEDNDTQTAVAP